MVPAAPPVAPPCFDRAFILLEEEVRELLSSTAALEADLNNVERQVADAESRRAEAAARRKDAEAAHERHILELNEYQEELRAGTWQPAAGAPPAADAAEPLPLAIAGAPVSGGTTSIVSGASTASEAPSARGGAASGDASGSAAAAGDLTPAQAGLPPQPLTQRLVNERCRHVLRILRDISEASRSMPDRDDGFTALLRDSYKDLLTALKAAIPPSSAAAAAGGGGGGASASRQGPAVRAQARSPAGGGAVTAAATGGGAARRAASLADAAGAQPELGTSNTNGSATAALNRDLLQRAVAAKRLYQQQQQLPRAVRSRSASPPPGPGAALYSGLPPLRVAPGGQAAAPSAETPTAGQPGAEGDRSRAAATERPQPQRQHQPQASGLHAAGAGRPSGSGAGPGAGVRRGSGQGDGAASQLLYEAARGPAGTAMARSLLQPLLQPDPEEEADWDWHWQEPQAEAVHEEGA